MTFWTCDIVSQLVSSQTLVVMAIVPIWNHQKSFYWKICFSMTFSTSDITSSLFSSQTLVVMAIVPIWNEQKTFYWKICFSMTFWTSDITSSLFSSQTLLFMAIVPIWNEQKLFIEKYVLHDIFNKWHHFLTCFVTNSSSYGHSSNLEITKQFFIEKYVFPWHFEQVTSLPHFFRHKLYYLWP